MRFSLTAPFLLATLALGACQTGGAGDTNFLGLGPKQTIGAALGAAGGGLLGAQAGKGAGKLALTAVGAVGGGLLGGSIGHSLDDIDRMRAEQAHSAAMSAPIGSNIAWNGNRASGTVTPTRDGRDQSGAYCREFQNRVTIGGQTQQSFGTACRQPDGSWRIVSN